MACALSAYITGQLIEIYSQFNGTQRVGKLYAKKAIMYDDTFVHIQDSTGMIRVVRTEEPRMSVIFKPTYDTDGCVLSGTVQKIIDNSQVSVSPARYDQIINAAEQFFMDVNRSDCFAFSRWKTCPYPQEPLIPPGK